MDIDLNVLPQSPSELKRLLAAVSTTSRQKIESLEASVEQWQLKYESLLESLLESFKIAQQHRYGASSEKNTLQEDLFDEADALSHRMTHRL